MFAKPHELEQESTNTNEVYNMIDELETKLLAFYYYGANSYQLRGDNAIEPRELVLKLERLMGVCEIGLRASELEIQKETQAFEAKRVALRKPNLPIKNEISNS